MSREQEETAGVPPARKLRLTNPTAILRGADVAAGTSERIGSWSRPLPEGGDGGPQPSWVPVRFAKSSREGGGYEGASERRPHLAGL